MFAYPLVERFVIFGSPPFVSNAKLKHHGFLGALFSLSALDIRNPRTGLAPTDLDKKYGIYGSGICVF